MTWAARVAGLGACPSGQGAEPGEPASGVPSGPRPAGQGTHHRLVNLLAQAAPQRLARLVHQPAYKDRWMALGADAVGNSPAAFAEIIRKDAERWGKVIKEAQIKAD